MDEQGSDSYKSKSDLFEEEQNFDNWLEAHEESKKLRRKKMEIEKVGNIDWTKFGYSYVKLDDGEPIDLELTDWCETEVEFSGKLQSAIKFQVIGENGIKVDKIWTVSSKKLATTLKQHVERAEKLADKSFKVRVLRTGQGYNTQYSVKALN